jgi:hypothetical protein
MTGGTIMVEGCGSDSLQVGCRHTEPWAAGFGWVKSNSGDDQQHQLWRPCVL